MINGKTPSKGWIPSLWISDANGNFNAYKNTYQKNKLPSKYHEDANRVFFNPPKGIQKTAVMIKLKEISVTPKPGTIGPPAPEQKKTDNNRNNGSGNNKVVVAPRPTKILANVLVGCPSDRQVSQEFKFSYPISNTNIDYGQFVLKVKKTVSARYELSHSERQSITTVGLTSDMKFSLNFSATIDSIEKFFTNLGGDVTMGDWLSIVASLYTTSGKTTWALQFTRQTINVFSNDSVKLKVVTKPNGYLRVEDSFEIELSQALAAVLICGVVVSIPAMSVAMTATAATWILTYAT